jgi:hypothetical protein
MKKPAHEMIPLELKSTDTEQVTPEEFGAIAAASSSRRTPGRGANGTAASTAPLIAQDTAEGAENRGREVIAIERMDAVAKSVVIVNDNWLVC